MLAVISAAGLALAGLPADPTGRQIVLLLIGLLAAGFLGLVPNSTDAIELPMSFPDGPKKMATHIML
jgi:hypothetical protein